NVVFIRFDYSPATQVQRLVLPPVIWERGAVDGLVIAGTNYPNFVRAVGALGIPFVLFSNNLIGRLKLPGMDTVAFDNEAGACLATEYLVALGHREIVF